MGYIYKLQSNYNNKVYIGLTKNHWLKRIKEHFLALKKGIHTNELLQNHYNKYKIYEKDVFSATLVEECCNSELCSKEIYYINLYKSYDRLTGFNLTYGGEQNIPTEHTILKKRLSSKNIPVYAYTKDGKFYKEYYSRSEAGRELGISDSDVVRAIKSGSQRHRNGFMFSNVFVDKMEAYLPKITSQIKTCYVFDKDLKLLSEHYSIADAARSYNIPVNFATNYVNAGSLVENRIYFSKNINFKPKTHKKCKIVYVYNKTGEFIESINGLKLCATKYNIDYRFLHQKIKNKKLYKDYYFSYNNTFDYLN